MYQKDYILKMIEMFADMIAGILGLIRKGELGKASLSIDSTYKDLLKQDSSFFTTIPLDKLTDTLLKEHNYTNNHLAILAGLFYAEAELCYAGNNNKDSILLYEKSLYLYKFIDKEYKTYSVEEQIRIVSIADRLTKLNQK